MVAKSACGSKPSVRPVSTAGAGSLAIRSGGMK